MQEWTFHSHDRRNLDKLSGHVVGPSSFHMVVILVIRYPFWAGCWWVKKGLVQSLTSIIECWWWLGFKFQFKQLCPGEYWMGVCLHIFMFVLILFNHSSDFSSCLKLLLLPKHHLWQLCADLSTVTMTVAITSTGVTRSSRLVAWTATSSMDSDGQHEGCFWLHCFAMARASSKIDW